MSATLEQSRTQQLRAAAEHAPEESREDVDRLLHVFYRHTATEDLLAREPEDLLGAALAERDLARHRAVGTANVRVTTRPSRSRAGPAGTPSSRSSPTTCPSSSTRSPPRSHRSAATVHLIVHPQLVVAGTPSAPSRRSPRDAPARGRVRRRRRVVDAPGDRPREPRGAPRGDLEPRLRHVLEQRAATPSRTGRKMREPCLALAAELEGDARPRGSPPRRSRTPAASSVAGRQPLHLPRLPRVHPRRRRRGRGLLAPVTGTGLGLLRYDPPRAGAGRRLSAAGAARRRASRELLIITKANSRSTVHRNAYLDYVGVKEFDDERRGHRASGASSASSPPRAYTESVLRVPIARRARSQAVLERTGFTPDSHSGKDLARGARDLPARRAVPGRAEQLVDIATVGDCTCRSAARPSCSCATTTSAGSSPAWSTSRATATTRPCGCGWRTSCERDLRRRDGRLHDARVASPPWPGCTSSSGCRRAQPIPQRRRGRAGAPSSSRPPAPGTRTSARRLRADAGRGGRRPADRAVRQGLSRGLQGGLHAPGWPWPTSATSTMLERRRRRPASRSTRSPAAAPDERRFKLYRRGPLSLTHVLPIFTHMGVEVVDERPYEVTRADGDRPARLRLRAARARRRDLGAGAPARRRCATLFQDAVARGLGRARRESDGFNALVLGAGLTWRQVVILRTVAKYLRQTRSTFSQDYVEAALVAHPAIARDLVDLFETRFDPAAVCR